MSVSFERLWTTLVNSDRFRQYTSQGLGRRLTRSEAYRGALRHKNSLTSRLASREERAAFKDVQTICLFIGHNKSGTSLVGSLLDAHPEAMIADDMDALQYLAAGFSRDQIYHMLLRGSRRDFLKGRVTARRVQPYAFLVPDQWQGRYEHLRVIGDSTSGSTTRRLGHHPDLLDRLETVAPGISMRFIRIVRNPFDPISYIMIRGQRSFSNAIEHYFTISETVCRLQKILDAEQVLTVRYETLVDDTHAQLRGICGFLGLETTASYLKACAGIVHPQPDRDRDRVAWPAAQITEVESRLNGFDFLQGYSFQS